MADLKNTNDYSQELEILDSQIKKCNDKIWEIAQEIIKCLEPSFQLYVTESVRKQVEKEPKFILEMSDENLHKLKLLTAELSKIASETVTQSLQDENIWLMNNPLYLSTTLDDNPLVWDKLQQIAYRVEELLNQFKFPQLSLPFVGKGKTPIYRLKYDLDPKDKKLSDLVEEYWDALRERENIQKQSHSLEQQKLRREAIEKWNAT